MYMKSLALPGRGCAEVSFRISWAFYRMRWSIPLQKTHMDGGRDSE